MGLVRDEGRPARPAAPLPFSQPRWIGPSWLLLLVHHVAGVSTRVDGPANQGAVLRALVAVLVLDLERGVAQPVQGLGLADLLPTVGGLPLQLDLGTVGDRRRVDLQHVLVALVLAGEL